MKKEAGRKKIFVIIAAAAAVLLICSIVLMGRNKSESYRSIKIVELAGNVTIDREKIGSLEAAVNMNLMSGDYVAAAEDAYVVLRLDADKYVMLGQGGAMKVTAEGNEAAGRTSIQLDAGSVLSEIQNPLGENSSFDIVTPHATMSVRGTVFEVRTTENDKDGLISVLVYDGSVAVGLDGKEPMLCRAGEFTEFTGGDSPQVLTEKGTITEEQMEEQMLRRLRQIEKEGRNVNLGAVQAAGMAGNIPGAGEAPAATSAPESSVPEMTAVPTASTPEAASPAPETAPPAPGTDAAVSAPEGTAAEPKTTTAPISTPEAAVPDAAAGTPEPKETQAPERETSDTESDENEDTEENEKPDQTREPETTSEPTAEPNWTPEPTAGPGTTAEPNRTPEPGPTAEPIPTEEPEGTPEPETTAEPTAEPNRTPEPEPTAEPIPTGKPEGTPKPGITAEPTAEPNRTPEPKPTAEPIPTGKPEGTPEPGITAEPTAEPNRTPEPKPTAEPIPTGKPEGTPEPGHTPEPTSAPRPTESPAPVESPSPEPIPGQMKKVTFYLPYIALSYYKDNVHYSDMKDAAPYSYGTDHTEAGETLRKPWNPIVLATPYGYNTAKADLSFTAWCTEDGAEWNFQNDVVQNDMRMYPIWTNRDGSRYYPVIYEAPETGFWLCNSIMEGSAGCENTEGAGFPKPKREGYILSGWEKVSEEGSLLIRFRAVWEKQGES